MTWRTNFLSAGIVCAAAGICIMINRISCADRFYTAVLFILFGLSVHLWRLQPAHNMTFKGIFQFYTELIFIEIIGGYLARKYRAMCQDVLETQTKTLKQYLKQGKTTEYGLGVNMADIHTVADFRSRLPLTIYEDYKTYVDRCLAGEENIFFPQEVTFWGATSGTTSGKSKLYPVNKSVHAKRMMSMFLPAFFYARKCLPNLTLIKFHAACVVPNKLSTTDRGVKIGPMSSLGPDPKMYECTPPQTRRIFDEDSCYYVELVFALRERELSHFFSLFSSQLLKMFSMAEGKWKQLVKDVRFGTLDPNLDIPEDIRFDLERLLTPRPERAAELATIFKTGFQLFVPKVWPDLTAITAVSTGSFSIQAKLVVQLYIGPNIPILSLAHISTEGPYGVMLYDQGLYHPDTGEVKDDYVIIPDVNFYEFVPYDHVDEDQPKTLLAHQVKKGEVYEMVITNFRGLYRYRTGDIVRICGYYGNAPRYQIMQRAGEVLNLYMEKMPVTVFQEAMTETVKEWMSTQLVNYAVTENVHVDNVTGVISDKMYYVVFVETVADCPITENSKLALDKHLNRLSEMYRFCRDRGTISPPRFIHVTKGTFDLVKELVAEHNPLMSRMQYKHVWIIRNEEKLKILLNRSRHVT